jgi:hypothetical protein
VPPSQRPVLTDRCQKRTVRKQPLGRDASDELRDPRPRYETRMGVEIDYGSSCRVNILFMLATAAWFLVPSTVLLSADAHTAARMKNNCCCAGKSKNVCPLKHPGRGSCDRGHVCSIERADAGVAAQHVRSLDPPTRRL